MPIIDIIAGARPNFMKVASIIAGLRERPADGNNLVFRLVHTGQHYDRSMSGLFFDELGLPEPEVNLEVGSGTHAEQTAAIMVRYEKLLLEQPCDLCLVVGDVNSTMACAITARKLGVPVAHVEGGLRSRDWTMPEEINRVVTDAIANWFFTTSRAAGQNLTDEGVSSDRIFFVGNTMIDTLLRQMPHFRPPPIWDTLGLRPHEYFVLTLHRPDNVDGTPQLEALLHAIIEGSRGLPIIFPVHPRTARRLDALPSRCSAANLHRVEPLGYLEFNFLVRNAKAVITDSGGITEETTIMRVPCLTLRRSTERPETVSVGTNELLGTDPNNLAPAFDRLFAGHWKPGSSPELWDGQSGRRIAEILSRLLTGSSSSPPREAAQPFPTAFPPPPQDVFIHG